MAYVARKVAGARLEDSDGSAQEFWGGLGESGGEECSGSTERSLPVLASLQGLRSISFETQSQLSIWLCGCL